MHKIKGATLTFGPLINIPVGVCTAFKDTDVKLKKLHKECNTPIKMGPSFCPTCEIEVENGEIVKGFEYAKGQYVTIDPDELSGYVTPRSSVVELTKFVRNTEFPYTMVESSYWLNPDNDVIAAQYTLIASTMMAKGVVALGKATLWAKETPVAVIVTDGNVMMLCRLHTADEYVDPQEIIDRLPDMVDDSYATLAEQIIDLMSGTMDERDVSSPSKERVVEFISAKATGAQLAMPETPETQTTAPADMFERLRESVSLLQEAKEKVEA